MNAWKKKLSMGDLLVTWCTSNYYYREGIGHDRRGSDYYFRDVVESGFRTLPTCIFSVT